VLALPALAVELEPFVGLAFVVVLALVGGLAFFAAGFVVVTSFFGLALVVLALVALGFVALAFVALAFVALAFVALALVALAPVVLAFVVLAFFEIAFVVVLAFFVVATAGGVLAGLAALVRDLADALAPALRVAGAVLGADTLAGAAFFWGTPLLAGVAFFTAILDPSPWLLIVPRNKGHVARG
jgi:hypothetical protein